MFRITDENRDGVLSDLISSSVTSVLRPGDGTFAEIKSMQTLISQVARCPETLRIMTQLEFDYEGVIDVTEEVPRGVLEEDWFDSCFVVADYSDPGAWCRKAISEAGRGKIVVLLLPARTNTGWFHDFVLGGATEIRFIKGNVAIKNRSTPAPDCLAIYKVESARAKRTKRANVAILSLSTSFTSTENQVRVGDK